MAELKNVFDIAGRSMAAQMVRLNTVASNIANADARAGSAEGALSNFLTALDSACSAMLIFDSTAFKHK